MTIAYLNDGSYIEQLPNSDSWGPFKQYRPRLKACQLCPINMYCTQEYEKLCVHLAMFSGFKMSPEWRPEFATHDAKAALERSQCQHTTTTSAPQEPKPDS